MGHAAGSEGWLGHYLTCFVAGVGEFFHFTWGFQLIGALRLKNSISLLVKKLNVNRII